MSKPSSVKTLLIVFLSILCASSYSQDSLSLEEDYDEEVALEDSPAETSKDTLTIKPRNLDEAKLESLKKDKDLDYSQTPTVGESLWERFWRWLIEFLRRLFIGAVNTNWSQILIYVICIVAIVIAVMALLKVDAFKVLFKGADAPSAARVFHENIHEMDFETLIKEATEKGDFRNAVRLIFLYSLKLLSDTHHIHWQPGKTNHDYLDELQALDLKIGLGELSFYFDYAWYGGFTISLAQYDKVKSIFGHWRTGIK